MKIKSLSMLIPALLLLSCGCAQLNTRQVVTTTNKDGSVIVTETKNRITTFFDSKNDVSKFKTLNTEKTQSVAIGALNQESSGSNAVQILKIVVDTATAAGTKAIIP